LYKIVGLKGAMMDGPFYKFNDALSRLRQLRKSGKKDLIVVDASTKCSKKAPKAA
jgi:hypothetical protein